MGRKPGIVGTACQAMVLATVAWLHVAAAGSAAGGLSAVPMNFQGDRSDRNAGLQAWGHLLGSAVLFNKAGNGVAAAKSLAKLVQDSQQQVALQSVSLAESGGSPRKAASLRRTKVLHSEEKNCPSENPLECWVFDMTEELNKQTKTAVSKAWLSMKGALGMDASKDQEKALHSTDFEDAEHSHTGDEEEEELPPFLSDVEAVEIGEPKIFNFEWEPFRSEVAGVEVEANLFNVAPCAVLVNARGVKVETTLIKVEPTLFSVSPKGVNVEGAVIEVAPKLISINPTGSTLDIELPGHIHVDGSAIDVSPVGEENDVGPGAERESHND